MGYTKRIKVYRVKLGMTMPLMEAPETKTVELEEDDIVVCIEDGVWIMDEDIEEPDEMSLAVVGKKFIEANTKLFQPL